MGDIIGEILPLALVIAISPVPIIAVILVLFSPKARSTSVGFLLGWVVGIVVAVTVFVLLAKRAGAGTAQEPSALVSWLKLLLGALMILLAVKQWRSRPQPGQKAPLPKWMSAIDSMTPLKAMEFGFLLSAVNPKNLAMCVAAASTIAGGGQEVAAIAIFTVIAASTVAVPVVGYAVAKEKMSGPLDRLKVWLEANSATVMAVLLVVIGTVLLGKGIGGLV